MDKRTTARGYSESQGQPAVDNKGARMFGITVSDIFYVLEHVCFSSLWLESTQVIVYANVGMVFCCFADYSELPELRSFRIAKNIMTPWPTP